MDTGYILNIWPVLERWPVLLDGLWTSMLLSLFGVLAGSLLGILGALGRTSPVGAVRWALRAYVELFRNTPLLVQLFLVFLGLPSFNIRLSPLTASCIALVLNNGAYVTEIVRAGIAATPRGQVEAAQSSALRPWQVLAFVVVRPALARVYPALVSQNVLVMLSTSVTSAIGVQELTGAAADINSETFRSIETFLAAAALYLLMNYALRLLLWGTGHIVLRNRRAWA